MGKKSLLIFSFAFALGSIQAAVWKGFDTGDVWVAGILPIPGEKVQIIDAPAKSWTLKHLLDSGHNRIGLEIDVISP